MKLKLIKSDRNCFDVLIDNNMVGLVYKRSNPNRLRLSKRFSVTLCLHHIVNKDFRTMNAAKKFALKIAQTYIDYREEEAKQVKLVELREKYNRLVFGK